MTSLTSDMLCIWRKWSTGKLHSKLPMILLIRPLPEISFYNEPLCINTLVDCSQYAGWWWENQTSTEVIGQEHAISVPPFKSWDFCTEHWLFNPRSTELICIAYSQTRDMYVTLCCTRLLYHWSMVFIFLCEQEYML